MRSVAGSSQHSLNKEVHFPMRVLFLDIDGVLNSLAWFEHLHEIGEHPSEIIHHLDPSKVERLNKVIERTGAQVVVSSTWRLIKETNTPEKLETCLKKFGYRFRIFGQTLQDQGCMWHDGHCDEGHRGGEIMQWLIENPHLRVRESFAIVDDSSDMGPLRDHLVHTTWEDGLQDEHVEQLVEMLNRKPSICLKEVT